MESQCDMILRHLQDYGSITPSEAIFEYGCFRLAARIADLRKAGYQIESGTQTSVNRYGKTVQFAKYTLLKEDTK